VIGGSDITLETYGLEPPAVLEAVTRVTLRRWPSAVFVNPETGSRFDSYADIAFGSLHELLVFRDEPARDIWERLGADPDNAHTLIYAIATADNLTLVVEDPVVAHGVIDELRLLFTFGAPWQSWRAA
jgi:hypothetical protein